MSQPDVIIYSNHLTVEPQGARADELCMNLARELISYNTVRNPWNDTVTSTPSKVFCERTDGPRIFRFHIEMKERVLSTLQNVGLDPNIKVMPLYEPVRVEFPLSSTFKPYDNQVPLIDFIVEDGYKKIITMPTGAGKTATFLFAMVKAGLRTVLVIPPKYIERWLTDTLDGFNGNKDTMVPLKPGEIMVIKGSKELRSLVRLAQACELEAKFIIISAQTWFANIKRFRENGLEEEMGWMHPVQLWETLGAGIVCVDEGHENFHANFRLELYSHAPKSVTLSATLRDDDPFLNSMYNILYPLKYRRDGGVMSKHAGILYVPYAIDEGEGLLKTSWRGRSDYSQLAFEADLLKEHNSARLANVLAMLVQDIDELFLPHRVEKYKLLLFFDSVEMVTTVSSYLADRYPELLVGKYTAEETLEVLDELEVIVATTKSADTGIDIKNLQMVQCFVARGSSKANIQMFGRIRKPKNPKANPVFLFYYATNIDQHTNYTIRRKEMFGARATFQETRNTYHTI